MSSTARKKVSTQTAGKPVATFSPGAHVELAVHVITLAEEPVCQQCKAAHQKQPDLMNMGWKIGSDT